MQCNGNNDTNYDKTNYTVIDANEPVGKRAHIPLNQYKRLKQKINKQKVNVVFANSSIELTDSMIKALTVA